MEKLGRGDQTIALVPSMASPLETLPDEAFENLLVVTLGRSPNAIEKAVQERGHDPSTVGVIPVWGSSIDYDGPLWTTDVVNPSDLTGVSMRFSTAMQHIQSHNGWVVFDNINILLMYSPEERVHQFLSSVVKHVRERNATGVYCFVRDAMTDSTYSRFENLYDTVIDYREL